jgi:hypothetical protein
MNFSALEKFIDQMGITYNITPSRYYLEPRRGYSSVCMHIVVYYQGNVEYDQHHCYSVKNDGSIVYDEGNQVKGVKDGVLVYLGEDIKIDNYFNHLARIKAVKYLNK